MTAQTEPQRQYLRMVPVTGLRHEPANGKAEYPPDAEWAAVAADGSTCAQCSLWWSNTPSIGERRSGLIGHYFSLNASSGQQLITHACRELAAKGCHVAIGPMDGSTWQSYRFITERGREPCFFLEPDNDDDWPNQFQRCGFQPLARYRSALQTDLSTAGRQSHHLAKAMSDAGIRIRCLNVRRAEEEFERLHALVQTSFRSSLLFTPLSAEKFVRLHAPLQCFIKPELVLVAEHYGRIAALLFAIPDIAQAQRGLPIDTVIVKTVAALPGRRYAGLAHLLAARAAQTARELGYRRAIHALMRESIASSNWSARYGATMRRYTLYATTLES